VDKNNNSFTSDQPDLFQQVGGMTPTHLSDNAPDLDIRLELLAGIKEALRQAARHGLGRERIIDRMNLCLPDESQITKRQFDGWTAKSSEDRPFPAEMLPPLIWALRGVLTPLEVITKALGLHVIDEQEALAKQLGETILTKTQIAQQERFLRNKLGG